MLELAMDRVHRFGPSRSPVLARRGMVATSQPVAALAGVDILRRGGNAVDAAVATAAMLNVVEPMSTGIGGDAFAIIHMAKDSRTYGLNASGRAPYAATLEEMQRRVRTAGQSAIPGNSLLAATVPGTVSGWVESVSRYGRLPLSEVLQPAIEAAENGFAVTQQIGQSWIGSERLLASRPDSARTWLLPDGRAPRPGQVFKNPRLAATLRLIAEGGGEAFYRGPIAEKIVAYSEENGGLFSADDFRDHTATWVDPIRVTYRGYDVLEIPPNGQGIAALEALNILAQDDLPRMGSGSADTTHLQIEAMKLAFQDRNRYVTDPEFVDVPVQGLLSADYAKHQRSRIAMDRALANPSAGVPTGGDTVYLCAVDGEGNFVSFINSLYAGWGCGHTVSVTGIMLQNRGSSFSLDPSHANAIAPHKRTRHTIIPGMLVLDGEPLIAFGVMGGDMQAQGHVQFVCNVVDFGMNLQDALDAPRWRYNGVGASVSLEQGTDPDVVAEMARRLHHVASSDGFYGGGQAILRHLEYGTLHGGSDPRRDGCAIGY